MPREVCLAPPIHIFQCPKLPNFWPVVCALFCVFIFGILYQILNLKCCYLLLTSPVTLLAIKLFSSFYNQFQLSALNLDFVCCLGLIDVFSANERSQIFAHILIKMKQFNLYTNLVLRFSNCSVRI